MGSSSAIAGLTYDVVQLLGADQMPGSEVSTRLIFGKEVIPSVQSIASIAMRPFSALGKSCDIRL